jgi:hypothetical protein
MMHMLSSHRLPSRARRYTLALALLAWLSAPGCSESPSQQPVPGSGVTFTYPADGQWDVPTGARLVLAFTDPIDVEALARGCGADGEGPFCVVGPDGPVNSVAAVAGERGTVIQVDAALQSGRSYRVYTRPALLAVATENLPEETALFSFHTRSSAPMSGQAPMVVSVNGEELAAFEPGGAGAREPILDFASFRVLFSEPIDATSAVLGDSVVFARIDDSGQELAVAGALAVQGIHLTFDPDADLIPGARYRLRLTDRILDQGGEPLDSREFEFTPEDSRVDGVLIEQILEVDPVQGSDQGESDTPNAPNAASQDSIAGAAANAIGLSHPLVGDNTIFIKQGAVASHMANPQAFGGPIPFTIRKGQTLATTGLDLALGGVVPAGLATGDIRVTFASDANGIIVRNPYRDPELPPNDQSAPVFIRLTFDVTVTADDAVGNAVLNQTIMNVQATGVAVVADGSLAIETVGTMELGLLGVASAPSNMVLRLRTSADARVVPDDTRPRLIASHPVSGSERFGRADSVLFTFTEQMDARALDPANWLIRMSDGTAVEVALQSAGSTLVVSPRARLDPGQIYLLSLDDALLDLAGNRLELAATDPTGGTGLLLFKTADPSPAQPAPPIMLALYPGVPCALEGALGNSPGRCAGGAATDVLYRPFTLPADRAIEGYFNQPMDAATIALGSLCGTGSVRVEEIGDGGACIAAVRGTLWVGERDFRFVPNAPWQAGGRYRLTVVGGADGLCEIGEVCSELGRPLNTDAVAGMSGDGDPNLDHSGGPDIVIPFTGAPASGDTYLPAHIAEPVDINGNGYVDIGEQGDSENRAGSQITGYGGIIDTASLDGPDCVPQVPGAQACIYLGGTIPVDIGPAQSNCQIGGQTVPVCVPAVIPPQVMLGTSVFMDATATMGNPPFTITMDNLPTGQILMRVRDDADGPITGYLMPGADGPRFKATLTLYMDAPDMPISNFNLEHDLRSKQATIDIEGPVGFSGDGRIRIDASNVEDVVLRIGLVHKTLPNNEGFVTMAIPAGTMQLSLTSRPVHRPAHL